VGQVYGIWGDMNGDDGDESVVGEASISLATACFGNGVNGNAATTSTMCFTLHLPGPKPCRGLVVPIGPREITMISKRASRSWGIPWYPRLEGAIRPDLIHPDLLHLGLLHLDLLRLGLVRPATARQAALVVLVVILAMGALEVAARGGEAATTKTKTVSGRATVLVQAAGATTTVQVS